MYLIMPYFVGDTISYASLANLVELFGLKALISHEDINCICSYMYYIDFNYRNCGNKLNVLCKMEVAAFGNNRPI